MSSPVRTSWASSPAARRTMLANHRRDTGPELALRSRLHGAGERFRVDWPIPGLARRRIDIAFPRRRVAVYLDGCFWHGCPDHGTTPKAHAAFWSSKIAGNRRRDAETDAFLRDAGWEVVRVWEHEETDRAGQRVLRALSRTSAGTGCVDPRN